MLITWDNKLDYVNKLSHKDKVRVAFFSAKLVQHLVEYSSKAKVETCLQLVEKWLRDEATAEECWEAAYATSYHASSAASYAATYATFAAYAVSYADDIANHALKAIKSANLDPLETQSKILSYIRELYVASLPEELASNWLYVASL